MRKLLVLSLSMLFVVGFAQVQSNELHPSWSPDAKWICIQSDKSGNDDIYLIHIETKVITQLTKNDSSDTSPVWSLDGETIAFESNRQGNSDIYKINFDGTGLQPVAQELFGEIHPAWDYDGNLLYSADVEGQWQLFKMDRQGFRTQLTFAARDHLAPAPGNRREQILFSISERGKHQTDVEIMKLNEETGEVSQVTVNSGVSSNASTHYTRNVIFFNTKRDGNWDIYKMNYKGTKQTSLTNNSKNNADEFEFSDLDGQPSLSPDGKWVAFTSGRNGNFDVWLMNPNGKDLQNLTGDWVKE